MVQFDKIESLEQKLLLSKRNKKREKKKSRCICKYFLSMGTSIKKRGHSNSGVVKLSDFHYSGKEDKKGKKLKKLKQQEQST